MNGTNSQTLADVCEDLFSLVLYLHESGNLEQHDVLYDRIVGLFASMEEKARELKIADTNIEDAKYALAGFIDETVGWASRLEQEFFRRNIAGEEFFTRLDRIKETKARNQVLEVYYLCLTLGFEGRYFRTPEKLQEYIEELQKILDSKSVVKLSPHGERPQGSARRRRSGIPSWLPWALAGIGIVVVGVVLVLLRIRITDWATGMVNRIQSFLR